MHSLRGFLGVEGEAVGELVCDRWAEWVDTRKKGGYGGWGHTKERALEVEEEGTPPQEGQKEPCQRGPIGDPPSPALNADDLARQITAQCRESVTGAMAVAVRDTAPAAVQIALEAAMKGKAEARVQRLRMEWRV